MVPSVLFVFACWYVVALHYRQLSIFATFHKFLRHLIVFSAMTKVKDGRKGGLPKVWCSARGGRPSPDANKLAELRAANDMLRKQLQQAHTLTLEPVASTSSRHPTNRRLHHLQCRRTRGDEFPTVLPQSWD